MHIIGMLLIKILKVIYSCELCIRADLFPNIFDTTYNE